LKPLAQEASSVFGFNGTARLWRHPAVAIRRGSVLEVSGNVGRLAEAARQGRWLGERTHEGFGRFRLDATLPGVTVGRAESHAATSAPDHEDEKLAAVTYDWCRERPGLAKPSQLGSPSISQWLDLVSDVERDAAAAIQSRRHPDTAGKRCWLAVEAVQILDKLEKLPAKARSDHARMFVRWLRAEMRKIPQ
jgi:hypothetical protein